MNILSRGIDISRWQGNFDMSKAKSEGIGFAIIKGGGGDDGLYKDSQFEANYAKAKAHALHVGAYWFSRALTVAEAVAEANYFYDNILKGKQFDLPVYIDVENKAQLNVGKRLLTDIIKAWCDTLEKRGYWVGIYSSLSYFNSYMYDNELTRYAHWVAQWAKECTYSNTSCLGMWQYGGETNLICSNIVAGVVCDQNYMLVDYPALIKSAGLNGYGKTQPALKSIDEIAREVLRGDWGNGSGRINRLTSAGYDAEAVQSRVNELCSAVSSTSSPNAIKVGDRVKCKAGVKTFSNGAQMATWVPSAILYVRAVESGGKIYLVSTEPTKEVYTGRVNAVDVQKI